MFLDIWIKYTLFLWEETETLGLTFVFQRSFKFSNKINVSWDDISIPVY